MQSEGASAPQLARLFVPVIVVLGGIGLLWHSSAQLQQPASTTPASAVATTSAAPVTEPPPRPVECIISVPGLDADVPVFPTEDGLQEFTQASATRDKHAMLTALRTTGGFLIPRGTKCYRIEGIFTRRVRITEGPHEGEAVWLPAEFTRGQ